MERQTGLFKISRFGTGESHACIVENGEVIPTCRMFGGTGRMLSSSTGRKRLYLIPGGKAEQATCKWCKPVIVPVADEVAESVPEFTEETQGMVFEWIE